MVDAKDVPLSPAQRSKIRRLAAPVPPQPGEEAGELNIVPYLDIIMNIIVFIIATISVTFMTTIDTEAPSAGGGATTRQRSKALNLSAWVTAEGIALKTSSGNIATGCGNIGPGITVPKRASGDHDFVELARCARELKTQNERFENETQLTITANPDVEYQIIINVIDAMRKDSVGALFPDIRFGVAR